MRCTNQIVSDGEGLTSNGQIYNQGMANVSPGRQDYVAEEDEAGAQHRQQAACNIQAGLKVIDGRHDD